ncbi:hypothetical protein KC678_03285 [Candidatus Dojkabacteria bacterium]|uniref:Uncharacterized protein n=1 Tax=Candidatus Dojkabacteria bacterium TaxID=2099670 RepID=A0A955L1Q6_9BACT|nr:hypothetical protein [Candidatus Dojkabacteria bacterium]
MEQNTTTEQVGERPQEDSFRTIDVEEYGQMFSIPISGGGGILNPFTPADPHCSLRDVELVIKYLRSKQYLEPDDINLDCIVFTSLSADMVFLVREEGEVYLLKPYMRDFFEVQSKLSAIKAVLEMHPDLEDKLTPRLSREPDTKQYILNFGELKFALRNFVLGDES